MTGALLALLVAAIWGLSPIFEKMSLVKASPFTAMTVRFVFTCAIVMAISLGTGKYREIMKLDGMTLLWICLGGIVGGIIGFLLYFFALRDGLTTKIIPIVATFPLFTAFYAWLFLKEQITLSRLAGIILVVAGVALINREVIFPD